MAPRLEEIIKAFDNQFFDCRLWRINARRDLRLPGPNDPRTLVGIKGIFEAGYSAEHRQDSPDGATRDPAMLKLWKLIGSDANNYKAFYNR